MEKLEFLDKYKRFIVIFFKMFCDWSFLFKIFEGFVKDIVYDDDYVWFWVSCFLDVFMKGKGIFVFDYEIEIGYKVFEIILENMCSMDIVVV